MNEFTRIEEEIQNLSPKFKLFRKISICMFALLTMRLWYLQILKGQVFIRYSENNRLEEQILQAPRGLILDRNQRILASNHLKSELVLIPQYVKDLNSVATALSPIIEVPVEDLITKIEKSKKERGLFFKVLLKKQLNLEQIYLLRRLKEQFSELYIQDYIVRFYPFENLTAHLLGYMGEISQNQIKELNRKEGFSSSFKSGDSIGQMGIEKAWESELRGKDGLSYIEVDAQRRFVLSDPPLFLNLKPRKPIAGSHIVLTLDLELQQMALKAMNRQDRIGPRKGAVVLMKTNGEILALMSSPSFNPNVFSEVLNQNIWHQLKAKNPKSFLNKTIQNHYPPGSIIKPFIALAALQEGLIQKETLIHSPAYIRVGRRVFRDSQQAGYGEINVLQALEQSSNTFFYQLAQQLTIDKMSEYLNLFGLGKNTNVKLPGEISGLIPSRKWKEEKFNEPWQKGEDLVHSIGQGYTLTTPLQIAVAFNILATKGLIVEPFLVRSILNSQKEVLESFQGRVTRNIDDKINSRHFQTIQEGLKRVVHESKGTARWWKIKNQNMAGKTGTSQVRRFNSQNLFQKCSLKPIQDRHHGWFAGFAPAENPEVVVVVLTENSCSGSGGSAPIARDLLQAYFNLKKDSSLDKTLSEARQ